MVWSLKTSVVMLSCCLLRCPRHQRHGARDQPPDALLSVHAHSAGHGQQGRHPAHQATRPLTVSASASRATRRGSAAEELFRLWEASRPAAQMLQRMPSSPFGCDVDIQRRRHRAARRSSPCHFDQCPHATSQRRPAAVSQPIGPSGGHVCIAARPAVPDSARFTRLILLRQALAVSTQPGQDFLEQCQLGRLHRLEKGAYHHGIHAGTVQVQAD